MTLSASETEGWIMLFSRNNREFETCVLFVVNKETSAGSEIITE